MRGGAAAASVLTVLVSDCQDGVGDGSAPELAVAGVL